VQGIFQSFWDGSDVNYCARSTLEDNKKIAVADDFGKVRVYKYPCLDKGSECVILNGHSSHVTCVKWEDEDRWLFSTGGED